MVSPKIIRSWIPMSETAYYILLSLREIRHGYGIMQHIEDITAGRIRPGAGTVYGTLTKLEADHLIQALHEENRRKFYQITDTGQYILLQEINRLNELYQNGIKYGGIHHD